MKITSSLKKEAWIYILLASTLLTTFFTIISVYLDYEENIQYQELRIESIRKTYSESLSAAIWNLDESQIEKQLDGIVKNRDILMAKVSENEEDYSWTSRNPVKADRFIKRFSFPLTREDRVIGNFELEVTEFFIVMSLFKGLLRFFLLQGIKTFIVSFFILFILERLILRHVVKISEFVASYDSKTAPALRLDRKSENIDELTILERKLNELLMGLFKATLEKEGELELQKIKAFNAAKLASLGEMAGGIAHEINNPLMIIRGNLGIALKLLDRDDEDSKSRLSVCLKNIDLTLDRIVSIVRGLLTFSRSDTQKLTEVKLSDVMEQTLGLVSEKFKVYGVELSVAAEIYETIIFANLTSVSQILINLLNNSFYAVKELDEKWVRIGIKNNGDGCIISLTDSGKGIPDEIADKVLEPFFTTKPVGKGTGLGLSISSSLARSFNGTLSLDKNSPNTRFLLRIPRQNTLEFSKTGP